MNTKKYKATTALTKDDIPPLSRRSTKMLNPKTPSALQEPFRKKLQ